MSWWRVFVPALLLPVAWTAAEAKGMAGADEAVRVAVTPSEADEDYALQGEYLGWWHSPSGRRRVGLQVVAHGAGTFSAVLHEGGLPGDGAVQGSRWHVQGQRQGASLGLFGEGQRILVQARHAWLYTPGGQPVGWLHKTHRAGPTLGLAPPPGAVVLFGSAGQSQFTDARLSPDGFLLSGVTTPMPVDDFHLHLEFRTPYMPHARGQSRGNSGVYIQRRYEVQILDSFGLQGEANECGGLYKQQAPDINMCLPPLAWQTYDIYFRAARWDDAGHKIAPAYITVFHNGLAVHYRRPIATKTGAGQPEGPQALPIHLQDHGDPVSFRNVWLVPGTSSDVAPASRVTRWSRCRR